MAILFSHILDNIWMFFGNIVFFFWVMYQVKEGPYAVRLNQSPIFPTHRINVSSRRVSRISVMPKQVLMRVSLEIPHKKWQEVFPITSSRQAMPCSSSYSRVKINCAHKPRISRTSWNSLRPGNNCWRMYPTL